MGLIDINGWEIIVLAVVGVIVLGPERLPEYAAKAARLIRQLRDMAEAAKGQLREQMGPEFDDVNWEQFDPRRYDPRRIVREALMDDGDDDDEDTPSKPQSRPVGYDPSLPTPYDTEAT